MVLLIQFLHASVYGSENGSISLQLSSCDFTMADRLAKLEKAYRRLFESDSPLFARLADLYLRHARFEAVELLSGDLLLWRRTHGIFCLREGCHAARFPRIVLWSIRSWCFRGLHLSMGLMRQVETINSHFYKAHAFIWRSRLQFRRYVVMV